MGEKKDAEARSRHRKKGAAGTGKTRAREKRFRVRSSKDQQQQLAGIVQDRKKRLEKAGKASQSTAFEKSVEEETEVPHHDFPRFFWEGEVPAGEPTQELKLLRKSLGVKVKGVPAPPPVQSFDAPGLPKTFAEFLRRTSSRIKTPSPIQAQVWPSALSGLDVIGIAPTGSGKTLAYILPGVTHILGQPSTTSEVRPSKKAKIEQGSPAGLVLVPTRELAKQVCDTCGGASPSSWLKKYFGLRAGAVYGGVGKELQLDSLVTLGVPHLLSATPGRLLDLLSLQVLTLQKVTYFVLDEADRMLALGFEPQLTALMKLIRPNRQVLLFSATFPQTLREAAELWMSQQRIVIRVAALEVGEDTEEPCTGKNAAKPDPATKDGTNVPPVDRSGEAATPEGGSSSTLTVSSTVHQTVHVCAEHKKLRKLAAFLSKKREEEKKSGTRQRAAVLVFCTKIKTLRSVARFLESQGERCAPMHSQIPQLKREQALEDLKVGKLDTLVATDVASRGIHITRLRYVVNYDFPTNVELYCHRIGRVGRQGVEGWAFSFFTRELKPMAASLLALLERCKQWVDPNLRALVEGGSEVPEGRADDAADTEATHAPESDPSVGRISVGSCVYLQGLQQSTELNGTRGRVQRRLPRGRWEVALDGTMEVKHVHASNLRITTTMQQDSAARASGLRVGAAVRLTGLAKMPSLNGATGCVRSWVAESGRWEVVLDGSEDVKNVLEKNLELASVPSAGLQVGSKVRLQGLKGASHLNGVVGHVRSWASDTDRWEVVLEGSSEVKAVTAKNIEVLPVMHQPAKPGPAAERTRDDPASESDDDDALSEDPDEDGTVGRGGGIRIAKNKRSGDREENPRSQKKRKRRHSAP